jgi:signal transduction histidine kinase
MLTNRDKEAFSSCTGKLTVSINLAMCLIPKFILTFLPLAILTLLFPNASNAEINVVHVSQNIEKVFLGIRGQYLKDVPEYLGIENVSSLPLSGEFVFSRKPSINFGTTDSTSWFRFGLFNTAQENKKQVSQNSQTEWFLHLGKRLDYYDEVQLFWRLRNTKVDTTSTDWESQKFGLYHAQLQGKRDPSYIKLILPEGQDQIIEFYLRAKTVSGFFLKPVLYSPDAYRAVSNKFNMFYGMYYGLAFSMVVYNLFTYFFLRDKVRIIFILYAVALSAYFLVANELSGTIFPVEYLEATRKGAQFLVLITFILCIYFAIVFLEVKKTMPIIYKVLQIFGLLSAGIILLLPFFSYYSIGKVLQNFSVVVILIILFAGYIAWFRGYRPAKYFLFSWIFLLGGGFIYVLNFKGIFPYPQIGDNAAQIGSGIEMVFLSLAIADRVKFLFEGLNAAQIKREEQLEKLTHQLVTTEERERRRIAGRLHDSIGQSLCATKLEVQQLLHHLDAKHITNSKAVSFLDFCIQETRSLTSELYPQELYQFGLLAAIQSLAQDCTVKSGLDVEVVCPEKTIEMTEEIKFLSYRVVSELLNNVVKHANAVQASIELVENRSSVSIVVKDDGRGFEYLPEQNVDKTCFGLFNIQERLHRIGGELKVQKSKGGGSTIIVEVSLTGSVA